MFKTTRRTRENRGIKAKFSSQIYGNTSRSNYSSNSKNKLNKSSNLEDRSHENLSEGAPHSSSMTQFQKYEMKGFCTNKGIKTKLSKFCNNSYLAGAEDRKGLSGSYTSNQDPKPKKQNLNQSASQFKINKTYDLRTPQRTDRSFVFSNNSTSTLGDKMKEPKRKYSTNFLDPNALSTVHVASNKVDTMDKENQSLSQRNMSQNKRLKSSPMQISEKDNDILVYTTTSKKLDNVSLKILMENLMKMYQVLKPKKSSQLNEAHSVERKTSSKMLKREPPKKFVSQNKIPRLKSPEKKEEDTEYDVLPLSYKVLELINQTKDHQKAKSSNESSLKIRVRNLEKENNRLVDLYEKRIKKLREQMNKIKTQKAPLSRMSEITPSQYTSEQKEFMLEDYEKLLMVLNDKHEALKVKSPEYHSMADEKENCSSEVLETMIKYLEKKDKYPSITVNQEVDVSCDSSQNSSVLFRPKKSINSTFMDDESGFSVSQYSSRSKLGELDDSGMINSLKYYETN